MENILYELFTGCYKTELPLSDVQRESLHRMESLEKKIKETFGLEFLDQLNTFRDEMEDQRNDSCFRSGFLLGVRLALEAVNPSA